MRGLQMGKIKVLKMGDLMNAKTPILTEEQRGRLVAHIAAKFGLPEAEVAAELDTHGVPILASDCVAGVKNPLKWF